MLDHEGQATGGQSETLPVEFKFEDHAVRTVQIDGTIRFVATDVCDGAWDLPIQRNRLLAFMTMKRASLLSRPIKAPKK